MSSKDNNKTNGKIKNWFTWALLAMLPGATGWFIVLTQEQIQRNRSETYKNISRQQKEEFLEMYHEWSQLTPQEKADNPWGTGPYGGPEIQSKLLQNQEERLLADLPDLLTNHDFPVELGEILYGSGWRNQVREYQKQIEYQEILSVCSSILMVTGGLGFLVGTALWIREKIAARSGDKKTADSKKSRSSSKDSEDEETPEAATENNPPQEEEVHLFSKKSRKASSPPKPPAIPVAAEAGKSNADLSTPEPCETPESDMQQQTLAATAVLAETLKEEADTDPILSSLMTPEPVAKELTELTEQMSAIREFAAEQQTQVKKLQDGYDWMLIKRFCLRIIRCVDNIDDRIRLLNKENKETAALEDIRDELIFALESSGVEPYEPEIEREYRGLEKYAEAVKGRVTNTDPEKTGKIAEVVRSGYQYLISEEDVKIVRCAQVKLYA